MSFANQAKLECLGKKIDNDCCAIAFLCAVIKCSGQINYLDDEQVLEVFTEVEDLYNAVNDIIGQYYGASCELEVAEDVGVARAYRYRITIPHDVCAKLIVDLGLCEDKRTDGFMDDGIPQFVIADDCCKRAFVKGVFVSCATSNIVIKQYDNDKKCSSGYHLEFVFGFQNLAQDFKDLLDYFDIPSKITVRKGNPLVYIKEYQKICDVLALVEATKCVLSLQSEVSIRELRNNVNRQTNCMNANLTKTVQTAVKQLNAINYIQENAGLESLDDDLMELCLLRLANPEESLDALAKLFPGGMSKSGINHRFNKILKYAKDLEDSKFKIRQL